jgi:hypothetical protein
LNSTRARTPLASMRIQCSPPMALRRTIAA